MGYKQVQKLQSMLERYVGENMRLWKENGNLEQIKILPPCIKDRLLKIFMSCCFFCYFDTSYEALAALVHPRTKTLSFAYSEMNDPLLSVISICESLEKVMFDCGLNKFTSKGLVNFFKNKSNLTLVIIQECKGLNDQVIKCIAKNCPKLKVFDIERSVNVTDKSLIAISTLKDLSSLNISYTKVTDNGISYLVEGPCRESLRELRISHCKRVTDDGLFCIIESCPNIVIFAFNNCGVSYEGANLAFEDKYFLKSLKHMTWTVSW